MGAGRLSTLLSAILEQLTFEVVDSFGQVSWTDVVSRQLGVECNTFRISVPETKPEACSEPLKFGWDCGRANDMERCLPIQRSFGVSRAAGRMDRSRLSTA